MCEEGRIKLTKRKQVSRRVSSYQTAQSTAATKKRTNTTNCLLFLSFLRPVKTKMLAGLWLRAVPQLLTACRARCATKAFQLQRSSCTLCTATASWERSLLRTAQVCQTRCIFAFCAGLPLLALAAGCWNPFPPGIFGVWHGRSGGLSYLPWSISELARRV